MVLWAGDMNFRVDMPHSEVIEHCEKQHYEQILERDEFHLLQKEGK